VVITVATRELRLDVLHDALLLACAVPLVLHLALNLSLHSGNLIALLFTCLGCVEQVGCAK
jgi:hypothetical protein